MDILTLRQAAALLKLHPNTLRSYAMTGRIPATKLGRDWRFVADDLVGWTRAGYDSRARVQPSADERKASWHSGTVQEHITLNSQHLTERSLDVLLERPTGKRPSNTTTD